MGEKSEPAAMSSIAALKKGALDLIASRPEGIYQSDLRRLLEIDSSKCSKVVSRLQSSGLIRREKVPASSTYLLKLSSGPAPSDATSASLATSSSTATSPSLATSPFPATSASSATAKSPIIDPSPAAAQSPPFAPAGSGENECGSEEMKDAAGDFNSPVHDGRIKRMIDRQIERLLDKRIYGQLNSRIHSPTGKIENAIDSSKNSDPSISSYYDCYTGDNPNNHSDEDLDLEGRIEGFFDICRSVEHHSHIDTYLTEIYLLYLTRAASF